MRTSVDIPDALMARIRKALQAQNRTFRDAVIEGLRRTLLARDADGDGGFDLRDASFTGDIGFASGFHPDELTASLRDDAEDRLVAEPQRPYQP